jgi:hypothetical protein
MLFTPCIYSHDYAARQDTLNTLHLDKISSDHKDQDKCPYAYGIRNINTRNGYHVVFKSQPCSFMIINFIYFRILLF